MTKEVTMDCPLSRGDAKSTSVGRDQANNASLESNTDDDTSGANENLEEWMEHIKRSAHEAEEKMKTFNSSCCIETQRNLKWRLAMRIASHSEERWTKKAALWNPSLFSIPNEQKCWRARNKMGRRSQRIHQDRNRRT